MCVLLHVSFPNIAFVRPKKPIPLQSNFLIITTDRAHTKEITFTFYIIYLYLLLDENCLGSEVVRMSASDMTECLYDFSVRP